MFRLIRREPRFFDLLAVQADNVVSGARMLHEGLIAGGSFDDVYLVSKRIHEIEHQGDDLIHELVGRLNKTFITPIDREDIHSLTSRLDDVLDYIDAVAKRLVTFRIAKPTAHAIELGRIALASAEETAKGIRLLSDLRQSEGILKQCVRINQLENESDQVLRDALSDLFNGQRLDPLEVIKWKDIYEQLEGSTDRCEDVANVMESVLVKYA
jgi:uncharacterized protein